jgi:SWI/SNF-related matrix-associated actin-dependent regulator of chromatin subfamily A containing DEAD/H box 1
MFWICRDLILPPFARFDQDFNPHNDRQAQARAYRIGQKRDVDVIKLITRGSIEEDMMKLGETKLALDEAVAGEGEEGEDKGSRNKDSEVKQSLMNALRDKLLFEEKSEQESADERTPSQQIE